MKVFAKLFLAALVASASCQQAMADQGSQRSEPAAQQMSPEGKAAVAVVGGAAVGYLGANAAIMAKDFAGNSGAGTVIAAIALLYAWYFLRENRHDAISKIAGPEYVGISGIAAFATGMAVLNNNKK
jgi:hypothetical protein